MTNSLSNFDGNLLWQVGSFLDVQGKEALFRTGRGIRRFYIEGAHFQRWIQQSLSNLNLPVSISSTFSEHPSGKNSWRVVIILKLSEDANHLMKLDQTSDDSMFGSLTKVVRLVSTQIAEGLLNSREEIVYFFLINGHLSIDESMGMIETLTDGKDRALAVLSQRGNLTPKERIEMIKKIDSSELRMSIFREFISRLSFEQAIELLDDKDTELKEIVAFHALWHSPQLNLEDSIRIIENCISTEQKTKAYLAVLNNMNIYLDHKDLDFFYSVTEKLDDAKMEEEFISALEARETILFNCTGLGFDDRDFNN